MSKRRNVNTVKADSTPAKPEAKAKEEEKKEEEKKKVRFKDRIRGFGEKHPRLATAGKYAVAVGAGALVALCGKSVVEGLGGYGDEPEDLNGSSENESSYADSAPAEKEEDDNE